MGQKIKAACGVWPWANIDHDGVNNYMIFYHLSYLISFKNIILQFDNYYSILFNFFLR